MLARALLLSLMMMTAAVVSSAAVPARANEPVLAVLYVDNHSGDAAYDVLEKGLADMLVTDLSAQGLTVVERARLEALIDEQKLQGTKFFDPSTAVKVGQGLGATHVVIGALAAMQPELRLDLRLVEVATSKIVVTAKVSGPANTLFDLEQQLVAKFVEAFEKRFTASPTPQTKVRDVAALLEYSRGVDLADKGELESAKKKIEQTIKLSPGFALARTRKDEIVKRLEGSRDRRDTLLEDARAALTRDLRDALQRYDQLSPDGRLAWRNVEQQLIATSFGALLTKDRLAVAKLGQDKALKTAMAAWVDSMTHYVVAAEAVLAAKIPLWQNKSLPADATKHAETLSFDTRLDPNISDIKRRMANFILMGEIQPASGDTRIIAPPLGNLERRYDTLGWKLLAEADKVSVNETNEFYKTEVLVIWGEALLFRNRTDEAIAKWQEILDRYPTSSQFDRHEQRIKEVLGIVDHYSTREAAAWAKGLATCDDMSLRVGMNQAEHRRFRMTGLQAYVDVATEVEKACRGNPAAKNFWDYLYSHVALGFGRHGRCAEFETWMQKHLAAGGSRSDVEGWRTNWTQCPTP